MRRALGVLLGFSFSLSGTPVQAQTRPTPRTLSAEELFKKVSPSVFVVVSFDASKQPIEQGSAVVIGVDIDLSAGIVKPQAPSSNAEAAPTANGWTLVKPAPESANAARFSKPARLLITNYHVVKEGVSFEIQRGARKWPATLVATNPDNDVAELRVEKLNAPAVPTRPFSSLAIGEHVYAIGAPEGLELTLSEGLISSLRESGTDRVIQTTAAISPGSSGGGLFDTSGRLVGITVAYLKEGQNLNFALPTDSIASARSATQWAELGSQAYQTGRKYYYDDDRALKSYKVAVDDYRQATRLNPEDEVVWRGLGEAASVEALAVEFSPKLSPQQSLADQDSAREEAINAYQKAVRLSRDDANAWWGLGFTLSEYGSTADGVNALKNGLRIDPGNIYHWEFLARDYCVLGQDDDALTAFATARALMKSPNTDEEVYLANSYHACFQLENTAEPTTNSQNSKFLEQALECAQSAAKLQPNDTTVWETLGMVYDDMKNRAGVMKVYDKLKTLDAKAATEFSNQYVLPHQHE